MKKEAHNHGWFKEVPAKVLSFKREAWDDKQWGWYELLKLKSWENDIQGALPNDKETLMQYAHVSDPSAPDFEKKWAQVMACFKRRGKMLFFIEHQEKLKEIRKISRERSKAGKAGANARDGKSAVREKDVMWNGSWYWRSELKDALNHLDDQIAKHKAKKPASGDPSHNICYI
jgi:hypothetical protein